MCFPQANAIKFITLKPATSQKVQKISNRFWLASILFSITHAVLKVSFRHCAPVVPPNSCGLRLAAWPKRCAKSGVSTKKMLVKRMRVNLNSVRYKRKSFFAYLCNLLSPLTQHSAACALPHVTSSLSTFSMCGSPRPTLVLWTPMMVFLAYSGNTCFSYFHSPRL